MDADTAEDEELNATKQSPRAFVSISAAEVSEGPTSLSQITPPLTLSSADQTPASVEARQEDFPVDEIYHEATGLVDFGQASDSVSASTMAIMKDLFLFDHYMDHTCRDLEVIPDVAYAKQVGIPQLAADNQGILYSIMALGATCLCIDILSGEGSCGQVDDLVELISAGDRYHRMGMQAVQRQLATNHPRDLAEAHAHTMLLFPYALARRRVAYLLNDVDPPTPRSGVDTHAEHISSLEWIIILRGITTTGRACWTSGSVCINDAACCDRSQKIPPLVSSHVLTKLAEPMDRSCAWNGFQCRIASKHPLFPVISSTRVVALEALQQKTERVSQLMRDLHRKNPPLDLEKSNEQLSRSLSLSACFMAVDLLLNMVNVIFNPGSEVEERCPNVRVFIEPSFEDSALPWLKRYSSAPIYDPALPACRTIFSWVNRTPDEYFQLLMKPLPPLTECEADRRGQAAMPDIDREIQLLAWDIWAHWLVFTILIEGESFFMAAFGVPDIVNLLPWFTTSIAESPGIKSGSPVAQTTGWWPGSMCAVAQQLRKYEGKD
ncbi:hypothetical protein G647_10184 [Cladophialophora carrionii CBS 160.54]|uniref:Transcription factor domain-containing protein n=1 Tax=Cladophialophora carrionii CBS 160.54 TaxID=1279043 RepID=V9DIK9_9EURO|nr:uncharacterized protein G647_10184 [Cladophialophora carrionii CBS 160.54]ETI26739.1 hypothetical protein G647_10184 [Cladophialophora carrionii CBS 160.54]